ncbi:4801_t:CDS:1, partial [Gigaspora margarita]
RRLCACSITQLAEANSCQVAIEVVLSTQKQSNEKKRCNVRG